MSKILVEVTADDLANPNMFDDEKCPVAKAMTRALGELVRVGVTTWGYSRKKFYDTNYLPNDVITNVLQLIHNSGPVEPFSFEVEVDD